MKTTPYHCSTRPSRGLTLLELTVVIAVSLFLIGLTFVGVQSWKNGAERASCVMNIYKVQKAVRGLAMTHGYEPGMEINARRNTFRQLPSVVELNERDRGSSTQLEEANNPIFSRIIGAQNYLHSFPECPGQGTYSSLGGRIPNFGEVYMTCSLASDRQHVPDEVQSW